MIFCPHFIACVEGKKLKSIANTRFAILEVSAS